MYMICLIFHFYNNVFYELLFEVLLVHNYLVKIKWYKITFCLNYNNKTSNRKCNHFKSKNELITCLLKCHNVFNFF